MIDVSKMIYIQYIINVNYVISTFFFYMIPFMLHFPQKLNSELPLLKLVQSDYPWTSNYISSQI